MKFLDVTKIDEQQNPSKELVKDSKETPTCDFHIDLLEARRDWKTGQRNTILHQRKRNLILSSILPKEASEDSGNYLWENQIANAKYTHFYKKEAATLKSSAKKLSISDGETSNYI